MGGVWQEVSRASVGGMRPEGITRQAVEGQHEGQAMFEYEVDLLIIVFLIWMTMEGAELPYPVQAEQDPQEEMEEYYQRVVSGRKH